jgi:hypothetical protein
MQTETERILRNLAILGSISQNDKVNTNADTFAIYVPTVMRGLARMWYGEARHCNILRIQETVRNATGIVREYMAEIGTMQGETQDFTRAMRQKQCSRIVRAMGDAMKGLVNLQQTYRDDITMHSQISLLVSEIEDFLSIIKPPSSDSSVSCGGLLRN